MTHMLKELGRSWKLEFEHLKSFARRASMHTVSTIDSPQQTKLSDALGKPSGQFVRLTPELANEASQKAGLLSLVQHETAVLALWSTGKAGRHRRAQRRLLSCGEWLNKCSRGNRLCSRRRNTCTTRRGHSGKMPLRDLKIVRMYSTGISLSKVVSASPEWRIATFG
jgi:hypothetical protein